MKDETLVRSIASAEYIFKANEQPPWVNDYKGVSGYLLRNKCNEDCEMLAITRTEFDEAIAYIGEKPTEQEESEPP